MIDFPSRSLRDHRWGYRFPLGSADANGEKSCFQAKNAFFHWALLFFSLGKQARFPLRDTLRDAFARLCVC
jgi:hypothetical protein